ncbi:polysaccharide deacetylase family protein [Metabacillus malikii]|uniref:Peptidoglycan/xylan/chitin deacetylase (PgdA/CDA1 family) n=1 Tax=Metabacillus malikii TaxID=1504265 RepID=A0ABT9ZAS1_9BACI|nr:polysaccharide deacetylase family protein [Metabacillus malikii]MDQ0229361.1 peptidoglycan/xylan/chitin deacetylase (PgdA/CDA1 family) [Metabacillus malikii]
MNKQVHVITKINTDKKIVAFTFDDGPNPLYTKQILDIFHEYSSRATFFMIGEQMKKHPDTVKEVVNGGHEIGNHTFTHPMLTQLNDEECFEEIAATEGIIEQITGNKPNTFRPPYLDYNEHTHAIVQQFGYETIGALNMDAMDWEQPGVEHIVQKTRNHIQSGSIIIFHDGFGDRSQTVKAVRILVHELLNEGYQLVTISELLKMQTKTITV